MTENYGFASKYSLWVEGIGNQFIAIEPSTDDVSISLYSSENGIAWNNEQTWDTAERGYTSIEPVKFSNKLVLVTPPTSNLAFASTLYESENGLDWSLATTATLIPIEPRDYDFVTLNGILYASGGTTPTTQIVSVDNQVWKFN